MKSKRKERLKTYNENGIYSLFFWSFIYITLSIHLCLEKSTDPDSNAGNILKISTIIYLVICIVITVKHIYITTRRNNALKYGNMVEGHVKAIKSHKTLVHSRNGDYISLEWDLIIGYKFNGEIQEARFGKYSYAYAPYEYISAGDKCNLYIYKGKAYLQNLYKENKQKSPARIQIEEIHEGKYNNTPLNELLKYSMSEISILDRKKMYEAVDERHQFAPVRSKTYLIVDPLHFFNNGKGYILLVEVHISSLIAYNQMDFNLQITISRYLKKYEMENMVLDEAVLKKDVEKIVKSNIRGSTIQALVKKVESILLIDYQLETVDEKEEKDEQLKQLKDDVASGEYTNVNFEEIAYCSATEIIKLKSKEFNSAFAKREIFSEIKSQEFMMLPAVIFLYPVIKVIYIDVFIISSDAYCEKDFKLSEKVNDYGTRLFKEFTQYEERLLKENIRQMLSLTIRDVDSSVEILDIAVEIQNY